MSEVGRGKKRKRKRGRPREESDDPFVALTRYVWRGLKQPAKRNDAESEDEF